MGRRDVIPIETIEQVERRSSRKTAISSQAVVPSIEQQENQNLTCYHCEYPAVITTCIHCKMCICMKCKYDITEYCIKCVASDQNVMNIALAIEMNRNKDRCNCIIM